MAEYQVGNIVYQVSMDVAQLLTAQRQLDSRLGQVEQRFNQTGQAVNGAEKALSSVSKVAIALTSALSVQQVAAYADAWTVVNNKLANSVRANEQLIDVTNRVFQLSQDTRTSLNATATLYSRLERGTREYNISAAELTRLTEVINQGFIVSGATATEAENAIIQLSQGIASGVLRGEEFNSVAEQGSRLMVALADSMGVNIGELRKMAAQGKLTTDVVVKGLLSQGNVIGKEFAKTIMTMGQSMQVASNNLTKFFGESSTVKAGVSAFNDVIITLSENMNAVSNVVLVVAAVMGSRFVGALTLATRKKLESAAASIGEARATQISARNALYAAQAATRKAWADKDAAASALNLAQAEYNVAKGSAAEAFALDNLNAKKSASIAASAAYVQAKNAETIATARSTAANKAASITLTGLKGALALIGGPMGAAMLAGGALFYYYQQAQQAKQASMEFGETLSDLIKKLKEMNKVQAEASGAKTIEYIKNLKDEMSDLEEELRGANQEQKKYWDLAVQFGVTTDENNGYMVNYNKNVRKAKELAGEIYSKKIKLADAEGYLALIYKRVNETIVEQMKAAKENAEAQDKAISSIARMTGAQEHFAQILGIATNELKEFNSEYLKINWGGDEGEKLKKQTERRLALSKLEGKARAELQAQYDAEDAGIADQNAIKQLEVMYTQIWQNGEEAKNSNKKSSKSANEATETLKRQQEALDRLNTGYKENSLEMAKYDVRKAMPEGSSESQLKAAEANAERIWLANQERDDKIKASELDVAAHSAMLRKKEEDGLKRMYDKHLIDEKIFQEQMKAIKDKAAEEERQRKVNEAVSPAMKTLGEFDPVQNLINEHDRKIEAIKQFEQQHTELKEQAEAARAAIEKKYQEDLASSQWEQWKSQNEMYQFLGDAVESLGQRSANSITGLLTGTQTANEAMRNLALTITNEAVSALVQMGMQQIKNMVIGKAASTAAKVDAVATGATITTAMAPAAAATSVATMGSAATVGMMAMATAVPAMIALLGARKNGGPVSPNGAYRIGENNKPEIFKANNGHQYMIPGDRGKVVSNRDIGKGGGGVSVGDINISFSVQTQGNFSEQDARLMSGMVKKSIYDVLIDERRPGGMLNE
ncbi:tape measure protein [Xenorhabdus japonica]|uniref:Tape measure domain-containing protein n=1 Tax=Xenorhabdus japonica TaxID=53341 RepID=A0A1I5CSQ9_9GAMM|nr:tape measure protein [Xenorhabdus japonica]SFN89957.1 tape measure domain-containing protein [Xenorhabdus japonica]